MFTFLDNWERRIRDKSTTLSEVFVSIGVIVSVIVGIVQIKRTKDKKNKRHADESDVDYDEKKNLKIISCMT